MSEDDTKRFKESPQLERIQTTLNALEVHIQRVETYVKAVEEKIDRHGYNTKPMWEKTQEGLAEVNRNLVKIGRKVDLFNSDLIEARITQRDHEERLAELEADEGGLTTVN